MVTKCVITTVNSNLSHVLFFLGWESMETNNTASERKLLVFVELLICSREPHFIFPLPTFCDPRLTHYRCASSNTILVNGTDTSKILQ